MRSVFKELAAYDGLLALNFASSLHVLRSMLERDPLLARVRDDLRSDPALADRLCRESVASAGRDARDRVAHPEELELVASLALLESVAPTVCGELVENLLRGERARLGWAWEYARHLRQRDLVPDTWVYDGRRLSNDAFSGLEFPRDRSPQERTSDTRELAMSGGALWLR